MFRPLSALRNVFRLNYLSVVPVGFEPTPDNFITVAARPLSFGTMALSLRHPLPAEAVVGTRKRQHKISAQSGGSAPPFPRVLARVFSWLPPC